MQQELIDQLFDIKAIDTQIKQVQSGLADVLGSLEKVAMEILSVNHALKTADSLEKVTKQMTRYKKEMDTAIIIEKEHSRMYEQLTRLRLQAIHSEGANAKAITKTRIELAEKNRQTKAAAEAELAAEKIADGYLDALKQQALSIRELTNQNKELRMIRDSIRGADEESKARIEQLNAVINANTAVIQMNQDKYVQQKMNIGNYQSALDGLKQELLESSAALQKMAAQGDTQSAAYMEVQKNIADTTAKIEDFKNKMLDATKDVEPMKTQLKALKQEAQQLELAMSNGAATEAMKQRFTEVTKEAAVLQDTIDDVQARIKFMASDTAAFDAIAQGVNLVNGGFQVWQGTMSVLGIESEAFKDVLIKLQGAQAISNGLLAMSNALNKDSTLMVALNTATTSKNILVKGAATAAQWLLNAAQYASPYILLTVGLVLLTKVLLDYAVNASDAGKKQKLLNEVQKEAIEITNEEAGAITKLFQTVISYNKGRKERADAIKSINDQYGQYLPNLLTENSSLEEITAAYESLIQVIAEYSTMKALLNKSDEVGAKLSENAIKRAELDKRITILQEDAARLRIQNTEKSIRAAEYEERLIGDLKFKITQLDKKDRDTKVALTTITDALSGSIKKLADAEQREQQTAEEAVAVKKAEIDAKRKLEDINLSLLRSEQSRSAQQLKLSADRAVEDLNLQKEALSKTEADKIQNAKVIELIDKQIVATRQKYGKDASDMAKRFAHEEAAAVTNTRLLLAKEGSEEELNIRKEKMQEQLNYELSLLPKVSEKRKELQAQYDRDVKKLDEDRAKSKLDIELKTLDLQLEAVKEGSEQEYQLTIQKLQKQKEQELTEAEKLGIDKQLIEDKYNKLSAEAEEKALDKKIEKAKEAAEEQARIVDEQRQQEEKAVLDRYSRGEISREEYEKQVADIRHKYEVQALQEIITNIEKMLAAETQGSDKSKELRKELADAKKQLSDEETEHELDNIDKINERRKKTAEKWMDYAKQSHDMVMDLLIQQQEARIDDIDKQIEELEEWKERELERLDESVMSDETRAAETKRINDQAEADKKKLEAERKEEMKKQFLYEKALALGDIAMNTATAIINILGQTGIYSPPFIAAAIALGTAQAIIVSAQKPPEYALGTDDHPGGLAVMGDGGKKEYALLPSGKLFETAAIPTLYDIPAHTQVFPDFDSLSDFFRPEIPRYDASSTQAPDFSEGFERLEKAIRQNKPVQEVHMNLDSNGIWYIAENGGGKKRFVNKRFKL